MPSKKKHNSLYKLETVLWNNKAKIHLYSRKSNYFLKVTMFFRSDAKIYKQVGGVLIDQTRKEAKTTLTHRIGHINSQIENTT